MGPAQVTLCCPMAVSEVAAPALLEVVGPVGLAAIVAAIASAGDRVRTDSRSECRVPRLAHDLVARVGMVTHERAADSLDSD